MIYFGIDFGTSNSCLAVYDGSALAVIDPESDRMPGTRVFPSVVAFDRKGEMVAAGWEAVGIGNVSPGLIVDQVKRWVGKPYGEVASDPRIRKLGYRIVEKEGRAQVEMGARTYRPEEIITFFLSHVVRAGLAYLRKNSADGRKINVIVTYPAYYAQNQVDAIREAVGNIPAAVKEVEFETLRLIPEPTASVCTALHDGRLDRSDRYVMVIDEGAGTLDTLLVDMQQLNIGEMEARGISIGGQAMLGGSDMDTRIMDWVLEQLKSDPKVSPEALQGVGLRQLRSRVEAAKIDLSSGRTRVAQIKVPGVFKFVGLTGIHFEALVQPVIDRCEAEIDASLEEIEKKHGISRSEIRKVILVGGPSRMAQFQKMALRLLPAGQIVDINPMECVAEGAAVSGTLRYRIPAERTYGLLRKQSGRDTFVPVIRKDTPLPGGGIISWRAKAFESVAIEPAQVLADTGSELACLTMGQYTFPASASEQTYHIAVRLDEERNVKVVVFSFLENANRYLEGESGGEGGDFRLEFRREVATRLIQPELVEMPAEVEQLWEIFRETGFIVVFRLRRAKEKIEECDRIAAEFGTAGPESASIGQHKTEVELLVSTILGRVNRQIERLRGASETDAYRAVRQLTEEILSSEAMRDLPLRTDVLDAAIRSADLYYDRDKILDLINRISGTKNDAWLKLRKRPKQATPEALRSIEATVAELDEIQDFLEGQARIRASSAEAERFRRGRIKEQELRNLIDNLLTQE